MGLWRFLLERGDAASDDDHHAASQMLRASVMTMPCRISSYVYVVANTFDIIYYGNTFDIIYYGNTKKLDAQIIEVRTPQF